MTDKKLSEEEIGIIRAPGGRVILCEACRRLGHCRLGVVSEEFVEFGRTVTELSCPRDHEGGPGVAHGGWTAGVLDECLGHLPLLCGQMTVTAKLEIEFLKPVPIERPLELVAWREGVEDNRWIVAGELKLKSTGVVLARARGRFAERDREKHFQRFRDWIASEEAGDAQD